MKPAASKVGICGQVSVLPPSAEVFASTVGVEPASGEPPVPPLDPPPPLAPVLPLPHPINARPRARTTCFRMRIRCFRAAAVPTSVAAQNDRRTGLKANGDVGEPVLVEIG